MQTSQNYMKERHVKERLIDNPIFICSDCGFSFKLLNAQEQKDLCPNCGHFNSIVSGDFVYLNKRNCK